MSRLGLRTRVVAASVLTLTLGVGILGVIANVVLRRQLDADARVALEERADATLATLDVRGPIVRLRRDTANDAVGQRSWVYVGRRALSRPASAPAVQRAADALATTTRSVRRDVGDLRLQAEPALSPARRRVGSVVVGVALAPYEHTERIALLGTLGLSVFLIFAGSAVAWLAVGAGLRPVADMAVRADDWSEHDLDRRFALGPPRDELSRLASTLDGLLGRIAASRRHEQRFSSEMAHELRTPLSGIRGEAELALRPGRRPEETRDALSRVVAGTDRMAATIETLLALARGRSGDGESDVREAVGLATDTLRDAAHHRGVRVAVDVGDAPVIVGADVEVVARALHPLVDNAIRHASGRVAVAARADAGRVEVEVRDDGAGLAPDELTAVFAPGRGLGLALSRRLAQESGGDVVALPADDGGRFVLTLPAL